MTSEAIKLKRLLKRLSVRLAKVEKTLQTLITDLEGNGDTILDKILEDHDFDGPDEGDGPDDC